MHWYLHEFWWNFLGMTDFSKSETYFVISSVKNATWIFCLIETPVNGDFDSQSVTKFLFLQSKFTKLSFKHWVDISVLFSYTVPGKHLTLRHWNLNFQKLLMVFSNWFFFDRQDRQRNCIDIRNIPQK